VFASGNWGVVGPTEGLQATCRWSWAQFHHRIKLQSEKWKGISFCKRYFVEILTLEQYWSIQTHTHTHLTALFPGLPGWAGTRKEKPIWILLKQDTVSGSGISWAICKSARRSRQITLPAPHHSVFYRPDALPAAQPTASKHWRHWSVKCIYYISSVFLVIALLLPSLLWHCCLGVRKSTWSVKIKWWGVGVVICLEQGAYCLHEVQLMPLHPKTPSSLASFKSWFYLSVASLPRLYWKRGY